MAAPQGVPTPRQHVATLPNLQTWGREMFGILQQNQGHSVPQGSSSRSAPKEPKWSGKSGRKSPAKFVRTPLRGGFGKTPSAQGTVRQPPARGTRGQDPAKPTRVSGKGAPKGGAPAPDVANVQQLPKPNRGGSHQQQFWGSTWRKSRNFSADQKGNSQFYCGQQSWNQKWWQRDPWEDHRPVCWACELNGLPYRHDEHHCSLSEWLTQRWRQVRAPRERYSTPHGGWGYARRW